MENSFEPTDEHNTLLSIMSDETKSDLKLIIGVLGYYHAIRVLVDENGMTEHEAKILADIGCYMLD
jgi:hypothetical protein